MTNIAVLTTCHNRAPLTEQCLRTLQEVTERHNELQDADDCIRLHLFLTDDGCSDDTAERVREVWRDTSTLHIIKGDGNLFWAGGMRAAWTEALKRHDEWDFYLALNDDTTVLDNLWDELMATHRYAVEQYGAGGVYMGCCRDPQDHSLITYCGTRFTNKITYRQYRCEPNGTPQLCHYLCANIMLIDKHVVDKIGIFHKRYHHSKADYDYSYTARRHGLPALVTGHVCGECSWGGRKPYNARVEMLCNMTLAERRAYMLHPVHSRADYMEFVVRTQPLRAPAVWLGWKVQLYMPKVYKLLKGIR